MAAFNLYLFPTRALCLQTCYWHATLQTVHLLSAVIQQYVSLPAQSSAYSHTAHGDLPDSLPTFFPSLSVCSEQEAVLADIPVVKGLPCLGQALLTQLPQWARDSPAAAARAMQATNFMRFRWLHLRPLAAEAAAAIRESMQDLREQLNAAADDNSLAVLSPTLLSAAVVEWLQPLTGRQPLRLLDSGGLLRVHGIAYGKQVRAVVGDFLRTRYMPLLHQQLQQAVNAAAGKVPGTVKEILKAAGIQYHTATLKYTSRP